MKAGDKLGRWTLVEPLGKGGNAEVWVGEDDSGARAAVKVLKSRNVASEPYQRFRQEVAALQELGDHPGILPILDASLPDRPTSKNRAWLAMPIAQSIRDALREAPLPDVVAAMATIAETLASLHDDQGLGHRDVKPANLYRYDGRWVVGDFGLVDLPGQEDLTQSDRPLGPINYIPYEMMVNPSTATAGPADVYSLAKSTWVLATGQTYPPQGEQPSSNRAISVTQYASHPRAADLDRILERSTRHDPRDRPSMRDLAGDLRAWLAEPENSESVPDLAELGRRLRAVAAPRLSAAERRARLEQLAADAADRLARLLQPVEQQLRAEYALTETDAYNKMAESILKYRPYGGMPLLVAEEIRATVLQGPGDFPVEFIIGRKVGVTEDGMLRLAGICYIGHMSLGGGDSPWEVERDPVPVDSLQAQQAIDEFAREVINQVPEWLARFLDRMGSPDS